MRRRLTVIAALLALAVLLGVLATIVVSSRGTAHLIVNGREISSDVAPHIVEGCVLVSCLMMAEALDLEISWRQDIQTVTVNRGGDAYPVPPVMSGSIHLVINGQEVFPDVPPRLIHGRIMVPILVVAQAFGIEATWNQASHSVIITGVGERVLKVSFLDVGQGDAIVIELPDGEVVLVDGGPEKSGETILSFLADNKIIRLDYVVATHLHDDHIGGLDEVLEKIPVEVIILPEAADPSKDAGRNLLTAIAAANLEPVLAQPRTDLVTGDSLSVNVLGPLKTSYSNPNDRSVILKVSYGDIDFLFMGDAEKSAEAGLVSSGQDLSAEVLKVGHHGSKTSSTSEFLAYVNPDYAVISVGLDNKYHHPDAETLDVLIGTGAFIFRTDLQGTIVATATRTTVTFNVGPWEYGGGSD